MPERDWDADEKMWQRGVEICGGEVAETHPFAALKAALAERRRLAALLTWRPGPPTEPGEYVIKFKSFPVLHCHCCADDLANGVGAGPLSEWHLGPLPRPEPPKAEVAG